MTASDHTELVSAKLTRSPKPWSSSLRVLFSLLLSLVVSGVFVLGSASSAEAKTLRLQDRSIAELATSALDALAVWREDESPAHYVDYLEGRDLVARQIASELQIDSADLENVWLDLPLVRQVVILTAIAQVGIKYRNLGKNPADGFDCSGLTGYAWQTAGVFLGHNSRGQYQAAKKISADEAQAGDLIWYPGHIMMYLGASNVVVHAPRTGRNVEIRQMVASRTRTAKYARPSV
jgi:hypothetical protein